MDYTYENLIDIIRSTGLKGADVLPNPSTYIVERQPTTRFHSLIKIGDRVFLVSKGQETHNSTVGIFVGDNPYLDEDEGDKGERYMESNISCFIDRYYSRHFSPGTKLYEPFSWLIQLDEDCVFKFLAFARYCFVAVGLDQHIAKEHRCGFLVNFQMACADVAEGQRAMAEIHRVNVKFALKLPFKKLIYYFRELHEECLRSEEATNELKELLEYLAQRHPHDMSDAQKQFDKFLDFIAASNAEKAEERNNLKKLKEISVELRRYKQEEFRKKIQAESVKLKQLLESLDNEVPHKKMDEDCQNHADEGYESVLHTSFKARQDESYEADESELEEDYSQSIEEYYEGLYGKRYEEGYESGYEEGYEHGSSRGSWDAKEYRPTPDSNGEFDLGYNQGYESGYKDGFEDGKRGV